jgi:hypothetical protein
MPSLFAAATLLVVGRRVGVCCERLLSFAAVSLAYPYPYPYDNIWLLYLRH